MCILIMEKILKFAVSMEHKTLLKMTNASLLSYKGLYLLNPNLINLLKAYLLCCLNSILTASIGTTSLRLQKTKRIHSYEDVHFIKNISYQVIYRQYIDL